MSYTWLNERGKQIDAVNIVAGVLFALSPWLLNFAALTAAMWNAIIVGAAVALIAIVAFNRFHEALRWSTLALGVWAMIAPWALGFSADTAALWAHLIAGAVAAVAAGLRLWMGGDGRSLTAA